MRDAEFAAVKVAVVCRDLDDIVGPEQDAPEHRSHVHQDVVSLGAITDDDVAGEAWLAGAVWIGNQLIRVLGDGVQIDPVQVGGGDKLTSAIAAVGEDVVEAADRTGRPLLSGLERTVEAGIVEGQVAAGLHRGASRDLNEATFDQIRTRRQAAERLG